MRAVSSPGRVLLVMLLFYGGCRSTSMHVPMAVPGQQPAAVSRGSASTDAVQRDASRFSDALKGKGSETESQSRSATAQKTSTWNLTTEQVQAVAPLVEKAALNNGIPVSLIYGIIWVESRFNPRATSPVGAMGLMQIMPRTAQYLAELMNWEGPVDAYDPVFNIAAGSFYIARLLRQYDGDLDVALAAYNAGPGNISRWMNNTGLPPVSISYYTMVQTAMLVFRDDRVHVDSGRSDGVVPNDEALDRLGLAILITGLSDRSFEMLRSDDVSELAHL